MLHIKSILLLTIITGSALGYSGGEVVDEHERVPNKVYYPSMTGDFFYAEIHKHETNGIYYVDARTERGEVQEFALLLSAREPHFALISTECSPNVCRVPSPYDITKSIGAESFENEIV